MLLAIVLNVLRKSVPMIDTAVMMITAIRAAMSPYSMAVTPASSFQRFS